MRAFFLSFVALFCLTTFADEPALNVVLLEPIGHIDASRAEVRETMPLYRVATNDQKYAAWMKNESAERALRLYQQALKITKSASDSSGYYIALVPGGNHAAVGFRLKSGDRIKEFPRQPYILLDAEESRFETTLLHESGHMVMALLAGGRQLDGEEMASIPHSTAALSDRATAFSEGWAIHLETVAAHLAHSPELRRRYHREAIQSGAVPWKTAEYFRHSADLTSYSQNIARYTEVRDNDFAFESAFQGPDYLRVQLEKARDFSSLRNANQLLQSEGFYASFFFLFLLRGNDIPAETVLTGRYAHILRAMVAMFASLKAEGSTPWLPHFVMEYMTMFPAERTEIVELLNDLSHGVFVEPRARVQWREHYSAALHLDREHLNIEAITAARKRWTEKVLAEPSVLFSRIGPQLACIVPSRKVNVAIFGEPSPVRFDLNTVPPGILRLVPGIQEDEVTRWIAERDSKPFQTADDFRSRMKLSSNTESALKF